MSIKIALIRHGDAPFHPIDSHRQLSSTGRAEALQTAQYLKEIQFKPDNIIHSGLDRARDTSQIIQETIAVHLTCEVSPQIKPESSIQTWAYNLMIWEGNLILVSHMPFLPLLLEEICGKRVFFPTAGCVILEKPSSDDLNWKIVQSNF